MGVRVIPVPRRAPKLYGADGRQVVVMQTAYEGGSQGARMGTFYAPDVGINAALVPNLATMRARTRALRRSSPLVQKCLRALASDLIGTGIAPRPKVQDRALRKLIRARFEDWARQVGFYAKQILAAKTWATTGEVLCRLRLRRPEDGLVVPLQLQMLSPDFLPLEKTEPAPLQGNRIIAGVEFDPIDRIVAYWLYREHPREAFGLGRLDARVPVRVAASEVLHVFEPEEPGQVRGEPPGATSIIRSQRLDVHNDAQLERQLVAGLYAGWFTNAEGNPLPPGVSEDDEPESDGIVEIKMQPGVVGVAPEGYQFQQTTPPQLANEYEAFQRQNTREIAAGWRVTYEQASGDYSGVTFSSLRAANIQQEAEIEQTRWAMIVPQFCQAVYDRWIQEAVLAGVLPITAREYAADPLAFSRARWIPPRKPWLDPESEANAWVTLKNNFLASRQGIVGSQGWDIEDIDDEILDDQERERDLGLVVPGPAAAGAAVRPLTERQAARARMDARA